MKKAVLGAAAVIILAGAAFAAVKIGIPYMNMKHTADTLTDYDGNYQIMVYQMKDNKQEEDAWVSLEGERTGNVFGGTISFPSSYSSKEEFSCEGFYDLSSGTTLIDIESAIESVLPSGVMKLASSFDLMSGIKGTYISVDQGKELMDASVDGFEISQVEDLTREMDTVQQIIENFSIFPMIGTGKLAYTGLLEEDFNYFSVKTSDLDASIYAGCPKKFNKNEQKIFFYVDYKDDSSQDFAFLLEAEPADTSVSMPASILTDEQVQNLSGIIRKVREMLEQ